MLRRPHTLSVIALVLLGFALGSRALMLFFWSGDDVFELPIGGLLADGHFEAWWQRSSSSGHTSLRVAPRLLWALDAAVYGPRAWGYFGTNLALHIGCMVAIYALAWRWTGSIAGAFAGAAVFGSLGPTSQVLTFLSAREDSVVTLTAAIMLLVWPRARRSWAGSVGVAGLYAVICTSKESGVVLPGVLLASDLLTLPWREALAPRALCRRYLPMTAVLGLIGAAWWQQTGMSGVATYAQLRGDGPGGSSSSAVLLANLYQGLWNPLADHPGQPLRGGEAALGWAVALGLPAATLAGAWRREHRAAWTMGMAWIGLTLLPPATLLGWGVEQSWGDGRYFHLPAGGLGLVVAAGVASLGARAWPAAVGLAGMMATSFAVMVVPLWSLPADYCRDLAAAAGAEGAGEIVLVWPRLDRGAQHMLDGGFLRRLVPSMPKRFRVLIEGEDRLVIVERGRDPWRDILSHSAPGFSLDDLRASRDRLVAPAVGMDPDRPQGPLFEVVELPLPPMRSASQPDFEWSFQSEVEGWWQAAAPDERGDDGRADPRRAPGLGKGGGLALSTSGQLIWPGDPRPPEALYHPELISPPIGRPAAELCRLDLRLRVHSPPGLGGHSVLDPYNFGVLAWMDRDGGRQFDAALPFRLADVQGSQAVSINLANSPTWRRSGEIYRIGITPSARAAYTVLESVKLRGCQP